MTSRNKYMQELLNNNIGWGDTLPKAYYKAVRDIVAEEGTTILISPSGVKSALRWKCGLTEDDREMKIIFKALSAGAFNRLRLKRNAKKAVNDFAERLHNVKGMREGLARNLAEFLYDVLNGAKEEILITPKPERGKAGNLIERGNACFVREQYQDAISEYTAALEIAPNNIAALYNRGVALSNDAENHMEVDGKTYWSGVIYFRMGGYRRFSDKDRDLHNKILRSYDGVMKSAIDDFSAVLKLEPKNTRALTSRGDAYRHTCDFDNAMTDFNTALKIDPGITDALMGRAYIYHYCFDDLEKAVSDYDTILSIDPQNESALENRDSLLNNIKRREYKARRKTEREKLIAEYTAVLKDDPDNIDMLHSRGMAYMLNKEYDKAVEDHSAILRIKPNDTVALCSRGRAQQDLKKAIADFTAALELEPDNINILHYRSLKYQEKRKYYKALDDLDAILDIDPQNTNILMERGLLLEKMGETRDACDDYAAIDRIESQKKNITQGGNL